MNPLPHPGNEPDPGDMANDPAMPPIEAPNEHDLPEEPAEELGNFA